MKRNNDGGISKRGVHVGDEGKMLELGRHVGRCLVGQVNFDGQHTFCSCASESSMAIKSVPSPITTPSPPTTLSLSLLPSVAAAASAAAAFSAALFLAGRFAMEVRLV